MNLIDHFRRQFAYDDWANREVLAALRQAANVPRAQQLLAHILAAEHVWIERLTGQPQSLPVWPDLSLEQCEPHLIEMARSWQSYLAQLSPGSLEQVQSYKNSKGELWSSSVEDVLSHVLLHSAYHRGQIAREMRAAGQAPAYTDFIHAVRQGHIR